VTIELTAEPVPTESSRPLHPLCELFPPIEGTAFDELVTSIKENGLRELIVILDGAILDGRNRYNACLAAGVEPRFTPFKGNDPVRFVLAANIHRRHLNESQRATIAAKIANLAHGGDRKSDQAANLPVLTQAAAAEMLNVSARSVRTARKVLEHAELADVAAITKGQASVSGVAKKLKAKREEEAVDEAPVLTAETREKTAAAVALFRVLGTIQKLAEQRDAHPGVFDGIASNNDLQAARDFFARLGSAEEWRASANAAAAAPSPPPIKPGTMAPPADDGLDIPAQFKRSQIPTETQH
jgi:hypothetical protein